MSVTPFDEIKESLSKDIPSQLRERPPEKWEKIGDVVIIRIPDELQRYATLLGQTYAHVLGCKSVLQDISGISGVYREPNVKLIFGEKETETVHIENGIRYRLDPQRIMFSSGNMDERIRMASVSNREETVVDLFAGIGYFTLPLAVYSRPKKVFACEINPVAYEYLCSNIVLNDVSSTVHPLQGDNREVAPRNVADRVVMGYVRDTYTFLPLAFECLKQTGGVTHYHDVFPNEFLPEKPLKLAEEAAGKYNKKVQLLNYRQVKSYSPKTSHVVLDLQVT